MDLTPIGNYIVYQHRRPDTGAIFYIGIGGRKDRHNSRLGRNNLWHKIVNKNNGGFIAEILYKNVSSDWAKAKEIDLIKQYGRINTKTGILCNLTDGGDGNNGAKLSEAHKAMISAFHKGHPVSEITRKKLKLSNSKWIVSQFDLITKQKIGEFLGCWEASKATGISQSGIHRCVNGSAKSAGGFLWSGAMNPHVGDGIVLKKVKKRPLWKVTPKWIVIKHGIVLEEFYGIGAAAIAYGLSDTSINRCILGKQKSAGGFTWSCRLNPEWKGRDIDAKIMERKTMVTKWMIKQINPIDNTVIAEFLGSEAAAKATGAQPGNIVKCILGYRSMAGGFKWMGEINPNYQELGMKVHHTAMKNKKVA